MRRAILTDIHANRAAFEAVLSDAASRAVDGHILLGDTVGYGPDPGWCADRARELAADGAIVLMGNHDAAATGAPTPMNPTATRAIDWTRARITPAQRAFLAALPLTATLPGLFLTHASADSPATWHYVTDAPSAAASFRATDAPLILAGHVHVPLLVALPPKGPPRALPFRPGTPVQLAPHTRHLAVIGSVGQPRDGDPGAAYAIFDAAARTLTFLKVPYDVALTARRIRAAGLPDFLAARLFEGL